MELTDYQKEKFSQFETIKEDRWLLIKEDRPDREEFIQAVKLCIDIWGNLELNTKETHFRRAYPLGTILWLQKNNKVALMDGK